VTSEQNAGTAPAPWVGHTATAHGLSPDEVLLRHDQSHGAAYVHLDADGNMEIRIQLDEGRYTTPERHAAELERDRRGLLRLAAIATQLAEEIGQRQREGGAS
jgi:hypothetical protein